MNLRQRLLKETKEYYEEDPIGRRGLDDKGKCEYSTISGKKCALGRIMTEETLENTPADGAAIRSSLKLFRKVLSCLSPTRA